MIGCPWSLALGDQGSHDLLTRKREYRDILYVLDRGHGLQAPCGESGSDCGFSAGFAGLQIHDSRRRSRGNVGIPAGISKGCGKGGKPALWLSMLSIPRHFHGLLLSAQKNSDVGKLRV